MKKENDYDLSGIGDPGALSLLPEKEEEKTELIEEDSEESETEEPESAEPDESDKRAESDKADESDKSAETDKSEESEESGETEEIAEKEIAVSAMNLLKMAVGILSGEMNVEKIATLMDADKAAKAIEEAYQRGLVEGRNAQIEERLEVLPVGAPDLCGAPPAAGRAADSIFDLARMAK
ncbi:MAG: hypothetical protein HDS45_04165 [Bacteroides sp.]|nr:hypothetical protein [Bacteroides sp.]